MQRRDSQQSMPVVAAGVLSCWGWVAVAHQDRAALPSAQGILLSSSCQCCVAAVKSLTGGSAFRRDFHHKARTECTTSAALVSFACSADFDLMWPRKASALWHVAFFHASGPASDVIHDAT